MFVFDANCPIAVQWTTPVYCIKYSRVNHTLFLRTFFFNVVKSPRNDVQAVSRGFYVMYSLGARCHAEAFRGAFVTPIRLTLHAAKVPSKQGQLF